MQGEKQEKTPHQQAFGTFTVTCDKCGSQNVAWENTLGYSAMSGGWGEAGFRCDDCGNRTDMIEA